MRDFVEEAGLRGFQPIVQHLLLFFLREEFAKKRHKEFDYSGENTIAGIMIPVMSESAPWRIL